MEDNVQSKTGILILKYPMEQGIITYWEHMKSDTLLMIVDNEKYNQLCCPKANYKKTIQIMFENISEVCM